MLLRALLSHTHKCIVSFPSLLQPPPLAGIGSCDEMKHHSDLRYPTLGPPQPAYIRIQRPRPTEPKISCAFSFSGDRKSYASYYNPFYRQNFCYAKGPPITFGDRKLRINSAIFTHQINIILNHFILFLSNLITPLLLGGTISYQDIKLLNPFHTKAAYQKVLLIKKNLLKQIPNDKML